MAKKGIAVIGANWGDEGKGLMTDYFTNLDERTIDVRINGGAQAGHTVTTHFGSRHVFSHHGAGTFNLAPTYLSEFFVCNPILFKVERNMLLKEFCAPSVFVHPDCLITTPYDILINQAAEHHRGDSRHGSVGLGFGETIERNEQKYGFTVKDLMSWTREELQETLEFIVYDYLPDRFRTVVGADVDPDQPLMSKETLDMFLDDCEVFRQNIVVSDYQKLDNYDTVVFEGAQGLMLDEEYGVFPHVSRSSCGAKNVRAIIDKLGGLDYFDNFDFVYVTRAYFTRHGAGPLPFEMELPYNIVDRTNIPAEFTGAIRFAPFDVDAFLERVLKDSSEYFREMPVSTKYAFTCLDQILTAKGNAIWIEDGIVKEGTPGTLLQQILCIADYASFGPTRDTIVRM